MKSLHLADAIRLVASELNEMCEASTKLQDVVGDLVGDKPPREFEAMNSIQRLDRMTQELAALAPFLDCIALYAAEYGHPDVSTATETIELESLRHRLQRAPVSEGAFVAGEPELF